ncbi:FtsX-like permease family protein [Clostridium estertheticum]|uniref:FtsX-like permease family protein n=1 Tax=Clostridium estertheticum TaxID=238834 RepID=UPI001CF50F63|nr:ABC transporter permease [Clostridium estertheticum]MCB2354703.1 ABC transporter permease [Clostridium estertheticum]WAG40947.1 ABC transporter permease [Clostridium estertheticum]
MKFFNIALNNIKKKFGSYLMYLISTIFSVTIFSLFCSIYFNPQFLKYRSGGSKMGVVFQAASIAVILFSSIFVLYSNKFFLKTRKKEIAIYSLLGMRKSQIGKMLFYENIIMGIFATLCGIILGMVFSRFFTMILFKLMATGTKVTFSIQIGAVVTTIVAFFVLFIISSLNAYSVIYRYKLIDLLSASKEGERTPKYSVWGGLLSILLMAIGYIISMRMNTNAGGLKLLLPACLMMVFIIVGTLLFFKNFIPMVMVKLKGNKYFYYKTANFISTSQIVYRIKSNSKMLSVITILFATTIAMTSATYSLYRGLEDVVISYAPFSYMCKNIDKTQYTDIVDRVKQIGKVKITSANQFGLIKAKVQSSTYSIETAKTPGMIAKTYILSQSDYKSIINNTKPKIGTNSSVKTDFNIELMDNECYFIDGNSTEEYSKNLKGSQVNVNFGNKKSSYDVAGVSLHKYLGMLDLYQIPTVVVSDKVYNRYLKQSQSGDVDHFKGVMFDEPMNSESTVDALNKIVPARLNIPGVPNVSYIGFYKGNFSIYGVYIFIGLFLGILFMLATGSIMYYKQIIEAQEEMTRYDILRKIGMNKKEVKESIEKQLAIVFGLPLLVGLTHTSFAILTYNRMLETMGKDTPTLFNASIVIAIFIVLYGFFYAISVKKYLQIVWGRE